MNPSFRTHSVIYFILCAGCLCGSAVALRADETCSSPYLARIEGQEEFVYVWTLGQEGLGDGADKLVTVDVGSGSPNYGKVVSSSSVEGRNEAHHGGFTDDRRQLWLAGLESSKIFIFDVHTDPAKPKLVKTISDFDKTTGGAVGPHGAYALPGRVLIPCLSNSRDHGGRTALVEYGNDGNYIATHWMPTKDDARGAADAQFADGYGYDARVLPRKNALLTSSFTGWKNYTTELPKLMGDAEAMKHFGQTMVMWDFHARQPKKVFHVPGAPLEVRWAWGDNHNYAFTATALTSKLWLVYADDRGEWQANEVAPISDVKGGVLPVDISLSADDKTLFVDCFGDGKCRVFDITDPHKPKQIYEQEIGHQLNMVSQSWDGKRLYFTTSLLARWDKTGENNDQFLRGYNWDGKELRPAFALDFTALRLGRPHHMLFGSTKLGSPRTIASK
ncbi:MAG TPA: selenium-binding protein SBP56-related protein [Chthoniobacterales bacterium]|jgi:selenium-binding protein 1